MKKITATILVLLMFVLMFPAGSFASSFSDLPENWSKTALVAAVDSGLFVGVNGKILPDAMLTRAQMAVVIVRALGAAEMGDLKEFSDVPKNAWYADDLGRAYKMGLIDGVSAGRMEPDAAVTREQVFAMLARALKLTKANTVNVKFNDADKVSEKFRGEVYALINAGYVKGNSGSLNPGGSISRAEFAQIIYMTFGQYINKAGEYTAVKDGNVIVNVPGVKLRNLTVNGDLIIGDGVGDGEATLDGVKVKGRLIVRGGGEHSIRIVGNSNIQSLIIARVDGAVRVFSEAGAEVGEVIVDGKDDVILEGLMEKVVIAAEGITVTANNSNIVSVVMIGTKSSIVVEKDSKVGSIVVNGSDTKIEGDGVVGTVAANADNVAVNTHGTIVTAGPGNTGITAGGSAVAPGSSLTNPGTGSQTGTGTNTGSSNADNNDSSTDDDSNTGNDGENDPGDGGPDYISLISVGITGDAIVGSTLTASTTPTGAAVLYQWKRSDTAEGTFSNITGATSGTYVLTDADAGKYIKVAATGTGDYTGMLTSTAKGPVAPAVPIVKRAKVTFVKEPADLALVVKNGLVAVNAENDGSYMLEEGDYTYTATREGYVPLTDIAFTVTEEETVSGTKSVNVIMTAAELSAAEVAAGIESIEAPLKDATSLSLPQVADGFIVAIKTSDKPEVIAVDGSITPPDTEKTVVLVLKVTRLSDGSTADTAAITVTVPAKTAVPTRKLTLNITPAGSLAGVELLADGVTVSTDIDNLILPDNADNPDVNVAYTLKLTAASGRTLYHDSYTGLDGYGIGYAGERDRTVDEIGFTKSNITQNNPSIDLSYINTPDTDLTTVTCAPGQPGSRTVNITIAAIDMQGNPINGIKAGDVRLTLIGSSDVWLPLGNFTNSIDYNSYGVEISGFDQNYSDNKLSFTLTFTTDHLTDPDKNNYFKNLADGGTVYFSASILRQIKGSLSMTLPG